MTTNTEIKTLAEAGALRQLKHNDGSDGFLFAYDKDVTDRYIAELRAALDSEKTCCEKYITERDAYRRERNEQTVRAEKAEAAVSQPVGAVVAGLDELSAQTLNALIAIATAAYDAADNSEERAAVDGGEDAEYIIQGNDFTALDEALNLLGALPDDKPGYTLSGGALAKWNLRGMLAAIASQPAKPADVGGVVNEAPIKDAIRTAYLQGYDDGKEDGKADSGCSRYNPTRIDWQLTQGVVAALAAQTAAPGVKEVRYLLKNALPVLKQHYRSLAVEVESYLASPQPVDGAAGVKPEGFKLRTSQGPLFCEQEPSVDRDLWVALYTAAPAPAAPVDLSDGADSCTVGCLRRDI